MTREDAINMLKYNSNVIHQTINGETDHKEVEALDMAIKALEPKPYEKFESAKDHIYKLAGDYKCWDNRLTKDEAVELCHILEQEPKKENEKCNYTIQNDLVVDGCRHKPVASTFSFFNECGDYKFCPYCGRKIEIEVEQ